MQNPRRHSLSLVITILACIVLSLTGHAQIQSQLDKVAIPQILPPSPDVTAFMKVGFGTTNMSTGAGNASIPLYTIKLKDYEYPISLAYSTQGLRADEYYSQVGLGWALEANGVITRSVKGIADEFGTREPTPAGFRDEGNAVNTALSGWLGRAADGSVLDSQVDQFNFRVNGHSGSFVLSDTTYTPMETSAGNNVISMQLTTGSGGHIDWTKITTSDGIKYTFQTPEISTSTNIGGHVYYNTNNVTAWFLDQVDLPNGEQIKFYYDSVQYTVHTGWAENVVIPDPLSGWPVRPYSQNDYVDYTSYKLDSILISNGTRIVFSYSSGRLSRIRVDGQKDITLNYDTNQSGSRSFLTKISDITGDDTTSHFFEYDNYYDVPPPLTCARDFLGFYSGGNRVPMIPSDIQYHQAFDPSDYSPPDTDAAKLGTLTKIIYPTGGTEEFIYEGNTEPSRVERDGQFGTIVLEGPGGGSGGSYQSRFYWLHNITVSFTQSTNLDIWASDAATGDPAETGSKPNTKIELHDETPGYEGLIFNPSATGIDHHNITTSFTLVEGHTYGIRMEAMHYTEISHVTMDYKNYENPVYDTANVTAPGVRVRQIKYTDALTNSTYSKYYTYAALNSLGASTGGGIRPSYLTSTRTRVYPIGENGIAGNTYNDYYQDVYSTSSGQQLYALYNTPVYYSSVIESDDACFANGGTEYTFVAAEQGSAIGFVRGTPIPAGGGQYKTNNGEVKMKRVFDRNHKIVQSEESIFLQRSFDLHKHFPESFAVRNNFTALVTDSETPIAYDVTELAYSDNWYQLTSKISTVYGSDGSKIKQTTTYLYNEANVLADSIVIDDNHSGKWSTVTRYANTIGDTLHGYKEMKIANRVNTPVHKAIYRDGILQQEQQTFFQKFSNTVLEPTKIQVRESGDDSMRDKIVFLDYDSAAHPRHLQKVNDFQFVYLWDSIQNVPIAEVKNAKPRQVAYTSFENLAYGNWHVSGTLNSSSFLTGSKSLQGTITTKVSDAGDYFVSLWVSGTASLNGTTISATPVATVNGWKLYKVKLTGLSAHATVTVSSTSGNYVDELRLYPVQAQMTSLTYKPFIGVLSQSDPNNRVSFYEYDTNNRLKLIRDQDRNIIKTFDYHYQHQQ